VLLCDLDAPVDTTDSGWLEVYFSIDVGGNQPERWFSLQQGKYESCKGLIILLWGFKSSLQSANVANQQHYPDPTTAPTGVVTHRTVSPFSSSVPIPGLRPKPHH